MKNKILAITLPVIITLLLLSTTIQVQATVTWEEDFEGKTIDDLDDWLFAAWGWNGTIYDEIIDPGFSVIDGILRAPSYQYFDSEGNMSVAIHNNTVAYGTWSFDWAPAASPTAETLFDYIAIIGNTPVVNLTEGVLNLTSDDEAWGTYYNVEITQNTAGGIQSIQLQKQEAAPLTLTALGTYILNPPVMGPIHIEVTRDSQGQFKVYYDTEEIINAIDNDITTSEYFLFTSRVGDTGIDNITINDAIGDGVPAIPASTVGFVIWMVTPTFIVLVIIRKRVIIKNRYRNED